MKTALVPHHPWSNAARDGSKQAAEEIKADGELARRQRQVAWVITAGRRRLGVREGQREDVTPDALLDAEAHLSFRAILKADEVSCLLIKNWQHLAELEPDARRV